MKDQWFYKIDGIVRGPINSGEIVNRVQVGEIPPNVLVSTNREGDWLPALNYACFQVAVYHQPHQEVGGRRVGHGESSRQNLQIVQKPRAWGKTAHVSVTILFMVLTVVASAVAVYLWTSCNTMAEARALNAEIWNLREENGDLNEQVTCHKEMGNRLEREINNLQKDRNDLRIDRSRLVAENRQFREELNESREAHASEINVRNQLQTKEVSTRIELDKTLAEFSKIKTQLREMQEVARKNFTSIARKDSTIRDLQGRATALNARVNSLSSKVEQLRIRLKNLQLALHKTKGEVLAVDPSYERKKWTKIDLGTMRAQMGECYEVHRKGQIVGYLRVLSVSDEGSVCKIVGTYVPQVGDKVFWSPQAVASK